MPSAVPLLSQSTAICLFLILCRNAFVLSALSSIPSMFRRLFLACGWKQMQNMLFYLAICHVLDAKRASFTTRKMPFYKTNDISTFSRSFFAMFLSYLFLLDVCVNTCVCDDAILKLKFVYIHADDGRRSFLSLPMSMMG